MLIVLEGCDGSGKSTIASRLATILDAEIIHCSSRTPNDFTFFASICDTAKKKNIIADRFCYGQFVYQDKKDRPLLSYENLNKLEVLMLQADAKVIFVTASEDVIEQRLSSRSEKIINGMTISQVNERFLDVFRNNSIFSEKFHIWDTTEGRGVVV